MRLRYLLAAFAVIFLPATVQAQSNKPQQQIIMGWVENVFVEDIDAKLKAKLDTGATTSSMRAEVVNVVRPAYKEGEKKPKRRVIFQIEDADGKTDTLERQLVRWVRIKDKKGGYQRRPVVVMEFCVAGRLVQSEVNLAPRKDFVYPVLVGRNMLRDGGIIVDPSKTFTAHARCPKPQKASEK
jgi:hypothetical protein